MGRVIEIASTGIDEYLQGLGSDPWGGNAAMGLRVPALATPDAQHRYLFLLASFSLGEGGRAVIRGYRQFSSLGFLLSPTRFIEQEIQSPNFRLPDGNISWALRRLGPPNAAGYPKSVPGAPDLPSFKQYWADGSCLLYHDYTIAAGNRIYTQLTGYNPPNLGRPWGTDIKAGQLGNFLDQRTYWRASQGWTSLDIEVEGPITVAFFASVFQSTGDYSIASSPLAFPGGLSVEEQFIGNFGGGDFPRPKYWRVGGSLIVEVQKGFVGP
jgi:hypothetical protein